MQREILLQNCGRVVCILVGWLSGWRRLRSSFRHEWWTDSDLRLKWKIWPTTNIHIWLGFEPWNSCSVPSQHPNQPGKQAGENASWILHFYFFFLKGIAECRYIVGEKYNVINGCKLKKLYYFDFKYHVYFFMFGQETSLINFTLWTVIHRYV